MTDLFLSLAESAPGPNHLADDELGVGVVKVDGDQRKIAAAGLVRAQDDVPAAQVEPANHRDALRAAPQRSGRAKLARIGDGAIDGHDRAGGQDRVHGIVSQLRGDRLVGIGKPLPVGQHVPFKPRGSISSLPISAERAEPYSRRIRRRFRRAGSRRATTSVLLGERSSSSSPRRINSTGLNCESMRSSVVRRYRGPSPVKQPDRVGPGLLDEAEQDFGGHGHAGLVVVPGPGGQAQATCQLGAAVVAEDFLANFSQSPR